MGKSETINVGLIGAGQQGTRLVRSCLDLPRIANIHLSAVCDIWPCNLENLCKRINRLRTPGQYVQGYRDYHEMLNEASLDAVLIAAPDFCHAEQTIACLDKGLHVYCEAEMSNTIEGARAMVLASQRTGKLLQIGRQRRSNPFYLYCHDLILSKRAMFDRLTAVQAQSHFGCKQCAPYGWPERSELPGVVLLQYGYESMQQLRNWKCFRKFGGGRFVEAITHQFDVFRWFLDNSLPAVVLGCATQGYWGNNEVFDGATTIIEFQTKWGIVRGIHTYETTNEMMGVMERIIGDKAAIELSENESRSSLQIEAWLNPKTVLEWKEEGFLEGIVPIYIQNKQGEWSVICCPSCILHLTGQPPRYNLTIKPPADPFRDHLVNFFDAIRGKAQLTCPASEAFATTVMTLKTLEAIPLERRVEFQAEDFVV